LVYNYIKNKNIGDSIRFANECAAGLVYNYVKNKNIGDSIRFANECATKVVQQKGVNTINENRI